MIHPVVVNPVLNPVVRVTDPVAWRAGKAGYPDGAILHWDATQGFTDQTGNQTVQLIGSAYPTVTAGFAINASGKEWGFDTTTGPVRTALLAGEVTLVQVVTLPLMSSLTDATDYSLFGDLLYVRRDGTAGSFKVSDGTNVATVAYDWSEGESVTVSCCSHLGALSVNVGVSKPPYDVDSARIGGVIYVGHRGAPLLYPEASLSGYRRITADGCRAIEMDVQLTSDGVPVVMHDNTVDRTCAETGLVISFTAAQWAGLHIDIGSAIGGEWASYTEAPPTWEQVVSEFGGKYLLLPEVKASSAKQAIVDTLVAYNVPLDMVIVQSFILSDLTPAITAGYKTLYLGTGETAASLAAAGVDFVGLSASTITSSAAVTPYTTEGVEVGAWTVNYAKDARTLEGYGVTLIMSDDVQWITKMRGPGTLVESFSPHVRKSGYTPAVASLASGYIPTSKNVSNEQFLLGQLCPVKGNPNGDSFVIDVDVEFNDVSENTRWIGLDICTGDKPHLNGSTFLDPGFRCFLRRNGELKIYYVNESGSTSLATGTSPLIALATLVSFRVSVTPESVVLERTDVSGTPATTTDARARGGYLRVYQMGVTGKVHRVQVSFDPNLPLSAQITKGHALPIGTGKITVFDGVASAGQITEAK